MCGQSQVKKEIDQWLINAQQTEIISVVESYNEGHYSKTDLLWILAKMMEVAYQAGYARKQIEGSKNG